MEISKEAARKFIIEKQGFYKKSKPTSDSLLEVLRNLRCLQLDTINVLERSHYLVMWSRVGHFRRELLDGLLFPDRSVFEYWAHAACMVPYEDFKYFIHSIAENRKNMIPQGKKWLGDKIGLLDEVVKKIRQNGPMSSKDFADDRGERRHGWWDWKPAKLALELLFWAGILMVDRREKFQRYYDLKENVLPPNIDLKEPTEIERKKSFILNTLKSWGLAKTTDFKDYYVKWCTKTNMNSKEIKLSIQQLLEEEKLSDVTVDDAKSAFYLLSEDMDKVSELKDEDSGFFEHVTFLSPFDNMTWCKPRIKELFEFSPKLEAYVPKAKRKYGYYTLNILYRDKFVGRLDPKLHRKDSLLEVKSLHLEAGFQLDEDFKDEIALTFQSLMKFLSAEKIEFSERCPDALLNLL